MNEVSSQTRHFQSHLIFNALRSVILMQCCHMATNTQRLIQERAHTYINTCTRQHCRTQRYTMPPQHPLPPTNRPPPTSCLLISLFLFPRRWCLCQKGARRPHKAGDDVTTNKNSIVALRNLIRSHWFMLWMETEYLEIGSSNKAIDSKTWAFTIKPYSSLSFCSYLWTELHQLKDDTIHHCTSTLSSFFTSLIHLCVPQSMIFSVCLHAWSGGVAQYTCITSAREWHSSASLVQIASIRLLRLSFWIKGKHFLFNLTWISFFNHKSWKCKRGIFLSLFL